MSLTGKGAIKTARRARLASQVTALKIEHTVEFGTAARQGAICLLMRFNGQVLQVRQSEEGGVVRFLSLAPGRYEVFVLGNEELRSKAYGPIQVA